MIHKRISFSGGQLMRKKYAFCKKHSLTKSLMEASYADSISNFVPETHPLFKKINFMPNPYVISKITPPEEVHQ